MSLTVIIGLLAIVQLVWLFVTWKTSGFLSALNLFLYSALASFVVVLSYAKDGRLIP